jgi:transcriptional regulator with XRE-family HTH domain
MIQHGWNAPRSVGVPWEFECCPPPRDSALRIGERLRAVRRARGESLHDIAQRCDLSAATLSRIETGKQDLSVSILLKMCAALETSHNDVLTSESLEPAVLAALADVERAKAAFVEAAERVAAMEKRLRALTGRSTSRRRRV